MRANQIAPPVQQRLGHGLLVVLALLFAASVAAFNAVLWVDSEDKDGSATCRAYLDATFTVVFGYAVPFLVEVALNVRFVALVWHQVVEVRDVAQTDGLRRLLLAGLVVLDPALDPDLIPVVITVECTYNTCSVAWPVIIISILKRRDDARQQSGNSANAQAAAVAAVLLPTTVQTTVRTA